MRSLLITIIVCTLLSSLTLTFSRSVSELTAPKSASALGEKRSQLADDALETTPAQQTTARLLDASSSSSSSDAGIITTSHYPPFLLSSKHVRYLDTHHLQLPPSRGSATQNITSFTTPMQEHSSAFPPTLLSSKNVFTTLKEPDSSSHNSHPPTLLSSKKAFRPQPRNLNPTDHRLMDTASAHAPTDSSPPLPPTKLSSKKFSTGTTPAHQSFSGGLRWTPERLKEHNPTSSKQHLGGPSLPTQEPFATPHVFRAHDIVTLMQALDSVSVLPPETPIQLLLMPNRYQLNRTLVLHSHHIIITQIPSGPQNYSNNVNTSSTASEVHFQCGKLGMRGPAILVYTSANLSIDCSLLVTGITISSCPAGGIMVMDDPCHPDEVLRNVTSGSSVGGSDNSDCSSRRSFSESTQKAEATSAAAAGGATAASVQHEGNSNKFSKQGTLHITVSHSTFLGVMMSSPDSPSEDDGSAESVYNKSSWRSALLVQSKRRVEFNMMSSTFSGHSVFHDADSAPTATWKANGSDVHPDPGSGSGFSTLPSSDLVAAHTISLTLNSGGAISIHDCTFKDNGHYNYLVPATAEPAGGGTNGTWRPSHHNPPFMTRTATIAMQCASLFEREGPGDRLLGESLKESRDSAAGALSDEGRCHVSLTNNVWEHNVATYAAGVAVDCGGSKTKGTDECTVFASQCMFRGNSHGPSNSHWDVGVVAVKGVSQTSIESSTWLYNSGGAALVVTGREDEQTDGLNRVLGQPAYRTASLSMHVSHILHHSGDYVLHAADVLYAQGVGLPAVHYSPDGLFPEKALVQEDAFSPPSDLGGGLLVITGCLFINCTSSRSSAAVLFGKGSSSSHRSSKNTDILRSPQSAGQAHARKQGTVSVELNSNLFQSCHASEVYHSSIIWLDVVDSLSMSSAGNRFLDCTASMSILYVNGSGPRSQASVDGQMDGCTARPSGAALPLVRADNIEMLSVVQMAASAESRSPYTTMQYTEEINASKAVDSRLIGQLYIPAVTAFDVYVPLDGFWSSQPFSSLVLPCLHFDDCWYQERQSKLTAYKALLKVYPRKYDAGSHIKLMCAEGRTGPLCGSCVDGFSLEAMGGRCRACVWSPSTSLLFELGMRIVLMIPFLLWVSLALSTTAFYQIQMLSSSGGYKDSSDEDEPSGVNSKALTSAEPFLPEDIKMGGSEDGALYAEASFTIATVSNTQDQQHVDTQDQQHVDTQHQQHVDTQSVSSDEPSPTARVYHRDLSLADFSALDRCKMDTTSSRTREQVGHSTAAEHLVDSGFPVPPASPDAPPSAPPSAHQAVTQDCLSGGPGSSSCYSSHAYGLSLGNVSQRDPTFERTSAPQTFSYSLAAPSEVPNAPHAAPATIWPPSPSSSPAHSVVSGSEYQRHLSISGVTEEEGTTAHSPETSVDQNLYLSAPVDMRKIRHVIHKLSSAGPPHHNNSPRVGRVSPPELQSSLHGFSPAVIRAARESTTLRNRTPSSRKSLEVGLAALDVNQAYALNDVEPSDGSLSKSSKSPKGHQNHELHYNKLEGVGSWKAGSSSVFAVVMGRPAMVTDCSRLIGILKIFISYLSTLQALKYMPITYPVWFKLILSSAQTIITGGPSGNTLSCTISNQKLLLWMGDSSNALFMVLVSLSWPVLVLLALVVLITTRHACIKYSEGKHKGKKVLRDPAKSAILSTAQRLAFVIYAIIWVASYMWKLPHRMYCCLPWVKKNDPVLPHGTGTLCRVSQVPSSTSRMEWSARKSNEFLLEDNSPSRLATLARLSQLRNAMEDTSTSSTSVTRKSISSQPVTNEKRSLSTHQPLAAGSAAGAVPRLPLHTSVAVTLIAALLYYYEVLLEGSVGLLACVPLPTTANNTSSVTLYWRFDTQLPCASQGYRVTSMVVAVPLLILLVLVVPLWFFMMTLPVKQDCHKDSSGVTGRLRCRLLSETYIHKMRCWEAVVLLRKVLILIPLLPMTALFPSVESQLLTCQFILGIAVTLQLLFKPYKDRLLSNLETASLGALLGTITLLLYAGNCSLHEAHEVTMTAMSTNAIQIMENVMFLMISLLNVGMIFIFSVAACRV